MSHASTWKRKARFEAGNAAYALGWIRDEAVVAQLSKLARSGNKKIRGMAVIALGYAAAAENVNPLSRCYENVSHKRDFDWDLLQEIASIL